MKQLKILSTVMAGLLATAAGSSAEDQEFHANMKGYQEVPAISTNASGKFKAEIVDKGTAIIYELTYSGLGSDVRQGHIHLGQRSVNGGISVFLCQTSFNPDPTSLAPTCPQEATKTNPVTGTLTKANLVGPAAQGIIGSPTGGTDEEFAELVRAIKAGVTYANVHTATFTGGEVRGQIKKDDKDGKDNGDHRDHRGDGKGDGRGHH